jgi:hypothetical protein
VRLAAIWFPSQHGEMCPEIVQNGSAHAVRHPWYSILYIQVLIAIALGILIGHFFLIPAKR